jgi:hypothetical protein
MTIVNRQLRRQREVRVLHFIHPPSQQEAKGYQHKHKHEFQFLLSEEETQPGEQRVVSAPSLEGSAKEPGLSNLTMTQPDQSAKKEKLHALGLGDSTYTLTHCAKSAWVRYLTITASVSSTESLIPTLA